ISEVPGFAKHTSTPPPTRVRTRLSAPFIALSPLRRAPGPHAATRAASCRVRCTPSSEEAWLGRRARPNHDEKWSEAMYRIVRAVQVHIEINDLDAALRLLVAGA